MAEQNFANHTKVFPPFHFFVLPVLLINLGFQLYWMKLSWFSYHGLFGVLLALALILGFLSARRFALSVQDRVIRLEMRLRLRGILPPDLQPAINVLTHRQLVALRFASDEEMAELVREVQAGKLTTGKDIKMRVKSWQPDWMRA